MRSVHPRILVSGIAGGIASNVAMLLTFRLLGFGWNADGILLDRSIQSSKLIAVWTEIEPLPLVVSRPLPIVLGLLIVGIAHAYLYRWISPAWPPGALRRGASFGLVVFVMTYLFWEFFTPYNQFGEPVRLILLELCFWAVIAAAEGLAIALAMERGATTAAPARAE